VTVLLVCERDEGAEAGTVGAGDGTGDTTARDDARPEVDG
jgi:hypothetical protein